MIIATSEQSRKFQFTWTYELGICNGYVRDKLSFFQTNYLLSTRSFVRLLNSDGIDVIQFEAKPKFVKDVKRPISVGSSVR